MTDAADILRRLRDLYESMIAAEHLDDADIVGVAIDALEAKVKVKPLVWEEEMSPRVEANTEFGEYQIFFDPDEDVAETRWSAWGLSGSLGHFADLDAAKTAAQADYEARIRAALEQP